jgi:hypothetical protein
MTERKKDLPQGHALSNASRRDVLFALASAWSSSSRPEALTPAALSIADDDAPAARNAAAAQDRSGRSGHLVRKGGRS